MGRKWAQLQSAFELEFWSPTLSREEPSELGLQHPMVSVAHFSTFSKSLPLTSFKTLRYSYFANSCQTLRGPGECLGIYTHEISKVMKIFRWQWTSIWEQVKHIESGPVEVNTMATENTQGHGHGETCDLSKSRFLQTWPESSCALQKGKLMCSN